MMLLEIFNTNYMDLTGLGAGMFICSILSVVLYRKQLMLSLLSLELVLLSIFIMLVSKFIMLSQTVSISFYLIILGACEASLGLSLLVVLTRAKGKDMLSLVSSLKF